MAKRCDEVSMFTAKNTVPTNDGRYGGQMTTRLVCDAGLISNGVDVNDTVLSDKQKLVANTDQKAGGSVSRRSRRCRGPRIAKVSQCSPEHITSTEFSHFPHVAAL